VELAAEACGVAAEGDVTAPADAGAVPTSRPAPTAFFSYAHHDVARARRIIDALRKAGVDVWWDEMLPAGATFAVNVEEALNHADAVIVLWSKVSVLSDWVRDEAAVGRGRNRLVPVAIGGVAPPLGFGQYHAADLDGWHGRTDDAAFQSVLATIWRLAGDEQHAPAPHATSVPRLDRRAALGLGGVALAASIVAGGAAWYRLAPPKPATATPVRKIAVLPFANLGGDPRQFYLSDGLADELRSTLAENPQIQVIAQSSSESFRDKTSDPVRIAKLLGVEHLVAGSVRRAGDLVRISVQLIDGKTGIIGWSQTFERALARIFAAEDEIARTVLRALRVTLLEGRGDMVQRRGGTANVAAYEAYLQGVQAYNLSTSEATDRAALAAFERAISLDRNYAAGYAAKARVLTALANSATGKMQMQALYAEALVAANKAVSLAPDFAGGWADMGYTVVHARLDVAAAAEPYQRSVDMGAGDADILSGYATFALRIGDFDKAREAIRKAIELDPLNSYAFLTAGNLEYAARRFAQALPQFRKALSLSPEMRFIHAAIGDVHYMQGALAAAEREYGIEKDSLYGNRGLAMIASRKGDRATVSAMVDALVKDYGNNSLYQQAEIFAQDNQLERALVALGQARIAGDSGLILARTDPLLDPLRKSARFAALLSGMGFSRLS
jgi:TolB-like protein/Tfp pilus assembly protein PilF